MAVDLLIWKLKQLNPNFQAGSWLDRDKPLRILAPYVNDINLVLFGFRYNDNKEVVLGLSDRLLYTEKDVVQQLGYKNIGFVELNKGTSEDELILKNAGLALIFSKINRRDGQYASDAVNKVLFSQNIPYSSNIPVQTTGISPVVPKNELIFQKETPTVKVASATPPTHSPSVPPPVEKNKSGCLQNVGIAVVMVFAIIFSFFFGDTPEERISKAREQISAGKYQEATKTVEGLKEAQAIADGLTKVNDINFQLETLVKMSNEDFAKLKSGENVKILEDEQLNNIMLNNIRSLGELDQVKNNYYAKEKERLEKERKDALTKKAYSYFNHQEGSHKILEKMIKDAMEDPKSYEHIETQLSINYNDGTLVVITEYRGNNTLGEKVVSSYIMKQDINSGKILSVGRWQ